MIQPLLCALLAAGPARAAPAAGWPANDGNKPTLVLFGDTPSPPSPSPEPLAQGTELPLSWSVSVLARQPPDFARLTLVSGRDACEVPVVENLVVEVRVSPAYSSDEPETRVRLARRVDASACEPHPVWYFGVVGDTVTYERFGESQGVPPEVAAAVPDPAAPQPGVSVGGHPIGETWLAYTLDSHAVLVRDGKLLQTIPLLDDAAGVVRADGQTWLFAGTAWKDRRHVLYDLARDPVEAVAWAEVDPEARDRFSARNAEVSAVRAAEDSRPRWEWLLAASCALGTASVLGALAFAAAGRRLRMALVGAIAAPLALYGLASGVVGALALLLSVILGLLAANPSTGGFLPIHIEPTDAAFVLFFGLSWAVAAVLMLIVSLLAAIPPLRRRLWIASLLAVGAIFVQHALWIAVASEERSLPWATFNFGLALPLSMWALAEVLPLVLAALAWEREQS